MSVNIPAGTFLVSHLGPGWGFFGIAVVLGAPHLAAELLSDAETPLRDRSAPSRQLTSVHPCVSSSPGSFVFGSRFYARRAEPERPMDKEKSHGVELGTVEAKD